MGWPVLLLLLLVAGCASSPPLPGSAPAPAVAASPSLPPHTSGVRSWSGSQSLARDLARIEQQLRAPATPNSQLSALGREQQAAYIQLARHPDWVDGVISGAPDDVRPAIQANVQAGGELAALSSGSASSDRLPEWKIVAPAPAPELLSYYREAESAYGVHWTYLAAINLVESGMGRIRGTSSASAQGPMQFLPGTWDEYGEGGDVNDPQAAILAAGRFLKARGAPDDMEAALYGYNPSRHYVSAISFYAQVMQASERAYLGYYNWRVYVPAARGGLFLEEGFGTGP